MNTKKIAGIAAATGLAVGATVATVTAMALATTHVTVTAAPIVVRAVQVDDASYAEDDPRWNCYTDGNQTCGDDLTTVVMPDGRMGAILPAASDGRVYVSWQDGNVTLATERMAKVAWQNCVNAASGTDASMFACDEAFPA